MRRNGLPSQLSAVLSTSAVVIALHDDNWFAAMGWATACGWALLTSRYANAFPEIESSRSQPTRVGEEG